MSSPATENTSIRKNPNTRANKRRANQNVYNAKYTIFGVIGLLACFVFQKIVLEPRRIKWGLEDFRQNNFNEEKQEDEMSRIIHQRSIINHFIPNETFEGDGARVKRSIGSHEQRRFAPFLMLDDFDVTPPAGFPDHPHHGQETITYVLSGMIAHEDFTGLNGILSPGDLQFMTAGRGIVHSEIPVTMENGGSCRGLQLWVDLPQDLKTIEPRYRNLRAADIPIAMPYENLKVYVISGKSYDVESLNDLAYTPVHLYHFVTIKAGTPFIQEFPKDFNVFLYVIKGAVLINEKIFKENTAIFFDVDGESIEGQFATDDSEFVLVGGEILNQPVVQQGPFVETDKQKLMQVFDDFESYRNGFERAENWESNIRKGIKEAEARELRT
ncbi:hypothetical protein KAFR_0G02680 [Kazachstania africana CBS 2517]|uniref:Pirin N-terminal domain-containing protein n=1 Tax=Kazachstania africana (strain ATCC 22294 / BCRC 22015 / CBS 2517 / CECT 1963 / NBRC 1671 / NRRL Y-8276) TaxID=1071382 RepID=H2AY49_KAZAF|nr:hypothetical protein KAFR_0G02680 [Kazachstania africana CBS 2517]CCF59299.1 hypothetical protein KAFR_0G02680 [Kazachstania africana CBS 2517]